MTTVRGRNCNALSLSAVMMILAVCSPVLAGEPGLSQTGSTQGQLKVPSQIAEEVDPLAGKIAPGLEEFLAIVPAEQVVSVLVLLNEQVDVDAFDAQMDQQRAPFSQRHETIVRALQETAAATQGDLVARMSELYDEGVIERYDPYWITNCIRMDATKELIEEIAARPDVMSVYYNYPIELIKPEAGGQPADPRGSGPELGVMAVRAPEVWAMGFTGDGVLVSTLDTGVDGNHPALASRWRGVADPRYALHPEWAFFDPYSGWTFPQDSGSHGTHTMGSVCGGSPGNQVGVAPGAQWIHAAVIDRGGLMQTVTDAILAFQWLIDPDGNPGTYWDVPQVCSNSWGIGTWHNVPPYNNPCDDGFWTYLDACEAAGIVILFSAGNEGSAANTLRRPADRAIDDYRTCAVGGIDANSPPNWTMYSSSSRGPTDCGPGGSQAIKPDIAAPAVNVISSVPGGGYDDFSGTSMASPHVNGVVALIREACPSLSVDEVKQVMYDTALDLGAPGKDNDYGYGLVDAYEAVLLALSMCTGQPRAHDGYYETPVDTSVSITLAATDYDGLPDPPGALTYIVTSLPDAGNTLVDAGDSHLIVPGDLPYTLVGGGQDLLYTPTGGYYGTDSFDFKANDGGVPPDGGDSDLATVATLVLFDPPLISTATLPDGYLGGGYGPEQLEASGGQPALSWEVLTAGEYFETDLGSSLFAEIGAARGWHADDNSWSYTLPFTFPYFGQEYTSVSICSNGFIDFASSATTYYNTAAELIANVRIAPLWDDLRTDGGGYDIYIRDSIGGQVTIRWDVRTYSGGHQVNMSCTLHEDGRIQFHYGSGNSPISATVGISAGDGVNYNLAAYDPAASLPNANSLEFTMPSTLPDGMMLSPEGVLSGVPLEFGEFSPTFRVTDSLNRSDQGEIALLILEAIPDCGSNEECADGNQCTDDVCSGGVCSNDAYPNGTSCDDGNACTTSDTCSGGACIGGSPPDCGDGNPCTDDFCDPASGCEHVDNNASCADGVFCNGAETCSGGSCQAGDDPCPGQECYETGGLCVNCLANADCDDGEDCTVDTCDEEMNCANEYRMRLFGDLVPPFCPTVCPQPTLDDIICVLNDYVDGPTVNGCGGNQPPDSTDLSPCGGNGLINVDDILAILDAFAQVFSCPHPCE